jgi:hypothetical protein
MGVGVNWKSTQHFFYKWSVLVKKNFLMPLIMFEKYVTWYLGRGVGLRAECNLSVTYGRRECSEPQFKCYIIYGLCLRLLDCFTHHFCIEFKGKH